MTVDSSWLLLALCILAHALVGRLPPWPWLSWVSVFVWLLSLVLVLCFVYRRLRGL